ncbi:hypothetical protein ACKWTF_009791 [Chironomus riparius]
MYRYVFKRFKDTIEFGFNVRKNFACTQTLSKTHNHQNNDIQQPKQNNSVLHHQEVNFLVPSSQRANYDDFKKKYNYKHPNSCNPFLHAITWSTALIAGFYASQLLCLYRRNHHFDPKKSFYGRYLQHKNKLLHRKLLCIEQAKAQNRSHNKSFKFSGCPLKRKIQEKRAKKEAGEKHHQFPKTDDEFKAFTEEFSSLNLFDRRFEQFFKADDDLTIGGHRKVFYNVNNDDTLLKPKEYKESTSADTINKNNDNVKSDLSADPQQQKSEDEAINEIMTNLSEMIGELEFQMGVESALHGDYKEAVEHFRMSSSSNNASACYNLALLYEQGLGVKKDLEIAMKLYQIASDQGHDKALYNMGVYFARGLGGAKKSFKKAKSYFEKAATYGNVEAIEALSLLLPEKNKKKPPLLIVPSFIVDDDVGMELIVAKNVHQFNNLQSIAVS